MDKKLTLSLDATVIEKAKEYAQQRGVSLSKMIENYLSVVTEVEDSEAETFSPTVSRLLGSLHLPANFSEQSSYSDYLTEKYR